ncbi:MAG: hypothetical protein NVSMB10_18270 [Steroidobacteraceae bacterium]
MRLSLARAVDALQGVRRKRGVLHSTATTAVGDGKERAMTTPLHKTIKRELTLKGRVFIIALPWH